MLSSFGEDAEAQRGQGIAQSHTAISAYARHKVIGVESAHGPSPVLGSSRNSEHQYREQDTLRYPEKFWLRGHIWMFQALTSVKG